MIVKINYGLGKTMEKMQNVYQRLKRTKEQTEMSNTLEGINSRMIAAADQINDLEDRMVEITVTEQNIEKTINYISIF